MKFFWTFVFLFKSIIVLVFALNCREIFEDDKLTSINWQTLKQCLSEVNSEILTKSSSSNIWRLLKDTFNGIENIPVEAYLHMGYGITAIPLEELRNLSMERAEMVEAFGAIREHDELEGFSNEKMTLIAQKVQDEWLGKNADTYSEYDLILMGEIVCYLNATVIEAIHADALKYSAEWVGNIKNCPEDGLQALAKLAKSDDAFGEPSTWSKLVVSSVGNIINGLSQSEIDTIDKDKLHLNLHFVEGQKKKKKSSSKDSDNKKNSTLKDENE